MGLLCAERSDMLDPAAAIFQSGGLKLTKTQIYNNSKALFEQNRFIPLWPQQSWKLINKARPRPSQKTLLDDQPHPDNRYIWDPETQLLQCSNINNSSSSLRSHARDKGDWTAGDPWFRKWLCQLHLHSEELHESKWLLFFSTKMIWVWVRITSQGL